MRSCACCAHDVMPSLLIASLSNSLTKSVSHISVEARLPLPFENRSLREPFGLAQGNSMAISADRGEPPSLES